MVEGAELPDFVRRAIYGEITLEEKRAALDTSTRNWWREYAARKNDEEEEHVADTLLYDERCNLPRMAPRPDVVVDAEHFDLLDMLRKQHVDAARSLLHEVTLVCSVEALAMLSAVRHIQF